MPPENSDDALYAELFGGDSCGPGVALPTGPDEPQPAAGAPPATVLAWAERTGRISAASRRTWEENFATTPAATDATLRILARVSIGPDVLAANRVAASSPRPATVPRPVAAASSATYTPRRQTASGLDVSSLPQRLQAAAARSTNRGDVVRWIERYAGQPDEDVGPAWLSMNGDHGLAAEVARDEDDAELEAKAVAAAQYQANARKHLENQAAELDARQKRAAGEQGTMRIPGAS